VKGRGHSRTVIVEFEDFETALACYRSREYQDAKEFRQGRAELEHRTRKWIRFREKSDVQTKR
jgi:uncharacterized protein (DUF1330 family)